MMYYKLYLFLLTIVVVAAKGAVAMLVKRKWLECCSFEMYLLCSDLEVAILMLLRSMDWACNVVCVDAATQSFGISLTL